MGGLVPGQVANPFSRDKRTHNEDTIPAANVPTLSSTEEGIKRLETFSCWTSDAVDEHTRELGLIENTIGTLQGDVNLLRQEVNNCVKLVHEARTELLGRMKVVEEQAAQAGQQQQIVTFSSDEVEALTSNIARFGKKATAASDAIQLELPLLKARVRKLEEARRPIPTYPKETLPAKPKENEKERTPAPPPPQDSTNQVSYRTQAENINKRQYEDPDLSMSKRRRQEEHIGYEEDELASTLSRQKQYEQMNSVSRPRPKETVETDDEREDEDEHPRSRSHPHRQASVGRSYLLSTVLDGDEEDDEYRPNSRLAKEVSPRGPPSRGRPRGRPLGRYATRGAGRSRKSLPSRLGTPEWERDDRESHGTRPTRGSTPGRGGYSGMSDRHLGGDGVKDEYDLSGSDGGVSTTAGRQVKLTKQGRPDRRGAHLRGVWKDRRQGKARSEAVAPNTTAARGQEQQQDQNRQPTRVTPIFMPPQLQQPSRSREVTTANPSSQQAQSTLHATDSRSTTQRDPSPANSNKTVEETPEEQEETRRRLEAEWNRENRNHNSRW